MAYLRAITALGRYDSEVALAQEVMSSIPAGAGPPRPVAQADQEVIKAQEKVNAAAQPEILSEEAVMEAVAPGMEATRTDSAALPAQSHQEQRRLAVADWSPSDCQADTRRWVDQDHEVDEHKEDHTTAAEPAKGVSHREEQAQARSPTPHGYRAAQAGTQSEVHVASSVGAGETTESDSEVDASEVFVNAQGQRGIARFSNGLPKQTPEPAKRKRQLGEQNGNKPRGTAKDSPKRPRWPVPSGVRQSPERAGASSPKGRNSPARGRISPARGRNSPGPSTAEALQNMQRTGSAALLPVITTGMPGTSSQPASAQSPIVSTAMNKFSGALQVLAQLLQAQQSIAARGGPNLQLSPFQNQPISPHKAPAASGPLMRNCFSETSADTLTAGIGSKAALALQPNGSGPLPAHQDNSRQSSQVQVSLAALMQTVNSSSSQGGSEHVYPASAHSAPPSARAGSGPLPASSPFGLTARASDSKHPDAKTMEGLLSKLGMPSGFLLPRTASEADPRVPKGPMETDLEAAARAASLSSFGSLISSVIEASRTQPAAVAGQNGGGVPHLPGTSPPPPKPQASNGSIVARSSGPTGTLNKTAAAWKSEAPPDGMPWSRNVGGTSASSFAPFGDRAPLAAKTQKSASNPPATTLPQPDPRILEWVLGARTQPNSAAAGLPTSHSAAKHAHSTDLDKVFPRGNSADGAGILGSGATPTKGLASQSTTLRRPIAIRPSSVPKDRLTLPDRSRSEGILDSVAHFPGPTAAELAAQGALPPRSPSSSQSLTELALLAQQTLTSGDLGRVMQWAGRELALRDKKVKEAEADQEEERKAHNAALNAVAGEVSRLKRGQTELAKMHLNLQESLKKKTADLEEKDKLVAQLSRGLAETTNTVMRAAKDQQRLQLLSEQLASALARRNTQVLEQIKQLEDLLDQGNTEEAKALLISFRRGLDTPQLQEEPAPCAGIPVPQTGPVTSA